MNSKSERPKIIADHDCFIVMMNINIYEVLQNFTHVINYEPQILYTKFTIKLQQICVEKKTTYAEFDTYKPELSIKKNLIHSKINYFWRMIPNRKIIVSNRINENTKLLEILENNLKMDIYPRNYDHIMENLQKTENCFFNIDLLIDQSTGCIIIDEKEIKNMEIMDIYKKLKGLMNNFRLVYFIILPINQTNETPNSNDSTKLLNLTKLCAYLKKTKQLDDMIIKIVMLSDLELFGEMIMKLYMSSMRRNYRIKNDENLIECDSLFILEESTLNKKQFLTIIPMLAEVYLLSLGCLNSYQAQYMLSKKKFTEIASIGKRELMKSFDHRVISKTTIQIMSNYFTRPTK